MRNLIGAASRLRVAGFSLEDELSFFLPRTEGNFCTFLARCLGQLPGALCCHIAQVFSPRTGLLSKIANTIKRWMIGQVLSTLPDLANHIHHFAGGSSQFRRILLQR